MKIDDNWIKIELETTKKATMVDVVKNAEELDQNKNGSNDD